MFRRRVKSVDYSFIHERYQDTALVIFKKQQQELKEKSGKRASTRRSIKLPGRASISQREPSVNESAETKRGKGVSTVFSIAQQDNFIAEGGDVVVPRDNEEDRQECRRLGVQSKVCSVL